MPKDTAAGTRYWVSGPVSGEEKLRIEINWFVKDGLPGFAVPEYNCSWNLEIEENRSGRF